MRFLAFVDVYDDNSYCYNCDYSKTSSTINGGILIPDDYNEDKELKEWKKTFAKKKWKNGSGEGYSKPKPTISFRNFLMNKYEYFEVWEHEIYHD